MSNNSFAEGDTIMQSYIPIGALTIFLISSLIAVKMNLKEKISYKDSEKKFVNREVCEKVHESVDEKLACLPAIKNDVTEIKTKINIFLESNGKK